MTRRVFVWVRAALMTAVCGMPAAAIAIDPGVIIVKPTTQPPGQAEPLTGAISTTATTRDSWMSICP